MKSTFWMTAQETEDELKSRKVLAPKTNELDLGTSLDQVTKWLPAVFDSRSAIRERLFLLSVLKDSHDSANWAYDPHRDTWSHVSGDELKVKYEGNKSLETLAQRGINYKAAMAIIGYPEK